MDVQESAEISRGEEEVTEELIIAIDHTEEATGMVDEIIEEFINETDDEEDVEPEPPVEESGETPVMSSESLIRDDAVGMSDDKVKFRKRS